MKRPWSLLLLILLLAMPSAMKAQERQDKPTIVYGNKARQMELGGLCFTGADEYDEYVLVSLTGLSVGQPVSVPGEEITQAIRRFWKHGLFSDVRVEADSIVNNKIYLSFHLTMRPRVSTVEVIGVKKSEQEDILKKCGIVAGNQITPNMVNRAKIVIKRFYDEKGFKNADVDIVQRDDPAAPDKLKVDILIDKHEKVKVNKIYITGNEHIPAKKFYGSLFKGGILKKTHQRGNAFLRTRKFIEEKYVEDKENIIERYNELGYRDAMIVSDSVVDRGDYTVDIYINLDEGQRYYVRGIKWVGNTIYPTDALENILRMNRGDVYNQKHINDRLTKDEDAVSNYYYNDGYVFNRVMPVEANVDGDSIDLEVHIVEGRQAALNRIRIYGNDRVYEDVIRRELMMKPGDMFSMDALKLTYQELGQMGHFDPEQLNINPVGDEVNGTVDLDIGLASKPSDQVEFSLGWGQTGVIGKLGLKFTNFSIRNLLGKNKNRRGIIPQGDGQEFEISGSTNGSYYQSYSLSFFDPWFGGKRPTSLSVSAFYSKQTDINSSYYNSSYYNN